MTREDADMDQEFPPGVLFDRYDIIVQSDVETGRRMKYYSRAADVEYWTEMWSKLAAHQTYDRQLRGHLPHQLRDTFSRWVKPGARVLEAGGGAAPLHGGAKRLGVPARGP